MEHVALGGADDAAGAGQIQVTDEHVSREALLADDSEEDEKAEKAPAKKKAAPKKKAAKAEE